jgi:hypothetical protein
MPIVNKPLIKANVDRSIHPYPMHNLILGPIASNPLNPLGPRPLAVSINEPGTGLLTQSHTPTTSAYACSTPTPNNSEPDKW